MTVYLDAVAGAQVRGSAVLVTARHRVLLCPLASLRPLLSESVPSAASRCPDGLAQIAHSLPRAFLFQGTVSITLVEAGVGTGVSVQLSAGENRQVSSSAYQTLVDPLRSGRGQAQHFEFLILAF